MLDGEDFLGLEAKRGVGLCNLLAQSSILPISGAGPTQRPGALSLCVRSELRGGLLSLWQKNSCTRHCTRIQLWGLHPAPHLSHSPGPWAAHCVVRPLTCCGQVQRTHCTSNLVNVKIPLPCLWPWEGQGGRPWSKHSTRTVGNFSVAPTNFGQ